MRQNAIKAISARLERWANLIPAAREVRKLKNAIRRRRHQEIARTDQGNDRTVPVVCRASTVQPCNTIIDGETIIGSDSAFAAVATQQTRAVPDDNAFSVTRSSTTSPAASALQSKKIWMMRSSVFAPLKPDQLVDVAPGENVPEAYSAIAMRHPVTA
jgi:hypothetical protein